MPALQKTEGKQVLMYEVQVEKRDFDAELAKILALAEQQRTLAESLAATERSASLETQVRILVSQSSTEPKDADT